MEPMRSTDPLLNIEDEWLFGWNPEPGIVSPKSITPSAITSNAVGGVSGGKAR